MKGYITLEGPSISKAEIQIQLPAWNKGNVLTLSLHPEYPTDLPQIHTCGKLIELAFASLEPVFECRDPISIGNLLDDAANYVLEALKVLENTHQSYPMTVAKLNGCPDDLFISFGVQNCAVIATLSAASQPNSTNYSFVKSIKTGSKSSLSTVLGTSSTENIVWVESPAPSLTAAHAMLTFCVNKVTTLRSSLAKIVDPRLRVSVKQFA